jgi:hypothetical protein
VEFLSTIHGRDSGLNRFDLAAKAFHCTFSFWTTGYSLPYKIGCGGPKVDILVSGSEFFPSILEEKCTDDIMNHLPEPSVLIANGNPRKTHRIYIPIALDSVIGTIELVCRMHNLFVLLDPHSAKGRFVFAIDIVHN